MKQEMICIVCPQGCRLMVEEQNGSYTVTGNTCKRGEAYGVTEMTAPTRVITSTAALINASIPRVPVKTAGAVPKGMIFDCMAEINRLAVKAPVKRGQVLIENVLNTGINVVATRSIQ